ncbi:class I SAM-dependent methyltransferase [Niabella aurantiaca]|uniref:class I SAM-dependent methyltransferase n=1 Tax=Niabella aurantiaca TaxID=379900 RepID=UPI00037132DE|nr:SAM-dependent methyltransferase [Niabella aurantiaca]
MELSEQIIQKIKREGPIRFQEFMECCLYDPGQGYYASSKDHIGVGGDYYTCATLTPAFGATIARQLEEMWRHLDAGTFTIVEYGAGDGTLCRDILSALRHNKPMYEHLQYCIIEKGEPGGLPVLDEKVSWHQSIGEIAPIQGCVLSNELLDNFPVHQVWMEAELMELFIGFRNGFVETWRPAAQGLKDYFSELGIELPRGFRTEINLQAVGWIAEVANAIDKGYVLTIDYGYPSEELYKSCRSSGTLLGYYRHAVTDALYDHIGQQDMTAHVNFSALNHWGNKNGLNTCGFTDQCHFLLSLDVPEVIREMLSGEKDVARAAQKASLLRYLLLADMGIKCKVLIQEKGGCSKTLSGLSILPRIGAL